MYRLDAIYLAAMQDVHYAHPQNVETQARRVADKFDSAFAFALSTNLNYYSAEWMATLGLSPMALCRYAELIARGARERNQRLQDYAKYMTTQHG